MKNMKRLLFVLGSLSVTTFSITSVVACTGSATSNPLQDSFLATYTATEDGIAIKSSNLGLTKNATAKTNYDFNVDNLSVATLNSIVVAVKGASITNPIYLKDASTAPVPTAANMGIAVVTAEKQTNITNINQVVTFKITLVLWQSQLKSGSTTAYEYVATSTTMDVNISLTVLAAPLKTTLSTLTLNSSTTLTVGQNLTYKDIELGSIQSDSNFKAHPLADNFTIKYYTNNSGTTEIAQTQTVPALGTAPIYVKVTAASNDAYWTGTTALSTINLTVTFVKTNLSTVTLPLETRVSALQGQSYDQINDRGIEDAFAANPLANGYTLTFYTDATGATPIVSSQQVPWAGDYTTFVKITAAANDPYWTGSTKITEITFKVNQ